MESVKFWENDEEHQLYYRWLLDQLEAQWERLREIYIRTPWDDQNASTIARKADRARFNYIRVKKRYDRVRFEKRWPH